jgi:hypothetical protein
MTAVIKANLKPNLHRNKWLLHNIQKASGGLGKVAIISLTCSRDEDIPSSLLELELRKQLLHNKRIVGRWVLEKITILEDSEVRERKQIAR